MPPPGADSDVARIGYVSARFRDTSVTKIFLGWLRERNRESTTVFAYHASRQRDAVTDQVRSAVTSFRELGSAPGDAAETIRNDGLHLLVFLDVGMEPYVTQLAALHSAPIACVAWDYPVTSGLPSIHYYLSSEAMEPGDAQDHYSEKLVLLPGLGVHYTKPVIPTGLLFKSRRDFGIREDAIVYLSSQTIFKYLPAQDRLFARIARSVPNAQFMFLVTNEIVGGDLERRLGRAFAAADLDAADRCLLLPEMPKLDYWNLHRNADVVLDTIGWSGGVSTFEAIALGVPVVTRPGSLMRGRQSSAILTQLGVTETIADTDDKYVEIAVRLGLDSAWRRSIVERMAGGCSRIYSDTRCVRALEDFFRQAVEERWRSGDANDTMRQARSERQGMIDTAAIFERDRYVVLPSLLKEPALSQFYRYARKMAQAARMVPGDDQVPGTPCSYGDLMMDGLLNTLLPKIEEACGLRLFPTYSYFRVYKNGDTLAKHTDRPACEISITLCLGFVGESWPIWIDGPHGASAISLGAGDALLYRGRECAHWREPFQGDYQAQSFLHYVDRDGPCAEWKFDKGRSTAGLQAAPRG